MEKVMYPNRKCFRYVIPFMLPNDNNAEAIVASLDAMRDSEGRQIWRKTQTVVQASASSSKLYEEIWNLDKHHIDDEQASSKNKMGFWVCANPDGTPLREFTYFQAPDNTQGGKAGIKCSCSLTQQGLLIFANQSCFLWYEIELEDKLLKREDICCFLHDTQNINDPNVHNFWEKIPCPDAAFHAELQKKDAKYAYSVYRAEDNCCYVPVFWVQMIREIIPWQNVEFFNTTSSQYEEFLRQTPAAAETLRQLYFGEKTQTVIKFPDFTPQSTQTEQLVPRFAIQFVYFEIVNRETFLKISAQHHEITPKFLEELRDYGCLPTRLTYHLANFNQCDLRFIDESMAPDLENYNNILQENYVSNISDVMYATAAVSGSAIVSVFDGTDPRKRVEDFFAVFLLNLRQYYALVLAIETLRHDSRMFDGKNIDLECIITDVSNTALLISRCMFVNVSYLNYYNMYNKLLIDKMQLNVMVDRLRCQMYQIDMLCKRCSEVQESKRQQSIQIILGLVPLLAVFSALGDSQAFITNIASGSGESAPWLGFLDVAEADFLITISYFIIMTITIVALVPVLHLDQLVRNIYNRITKRKKK